MAVLVFGSAIVVFMVACLAAPGAASPSLEPALEAVAGAPLHTPIYDYGESPHSGLPVLKPSGETTAQIVRLPYISKTNTSTDIVLNLPPAPSQFLSPTPSSSSRTTELRV